LFSDDDDNDEDGNESDGKYYQPAEQHNGEGPRPLQTKSNAPWRHHRFVGEMKQWMTRVREKRESFAVGIRESQEGGNEKGFD
jgi:hypothetical protein